MLRHHLQNAWRTIRHHKLYTTINILGLSPGICACIVIYTIARYDLGFDKFHPDGDRIYRIIGDVQLVDGSTLFLNSPFEGVAGIEHAIPGFQQQVGFHTLSFGITVPADHGKPATDFDSRQEGSYASSVILTGPSFFDLFPHTWLAGNASVLQEPHRVVLSAEAARKYFGVLTPERYIGKTLVYGDSGDSLSVTVAGIVKDWTGLSDLAYTSFISMSTVSNSWLRKLFPTTDWSSLQPPQSRAFVKLAPGVRPEQVNAALANFVSKAHANFIPGATDLRLYLQPLAQMHYNPDFQSTDDGDNFRKAYLPLLYALMGVAFFILVLAIINFVNLSTAQSLQRIKEVGIKKVMGSSRKRLVGQFLTETLIVTGIAVILSTLLVRPVISLFHDYIPEGVHFSLDLGSFCFLLCILLFTALAAGLYPALLLAAHLPALTLRGVFSNTGSGGGARLRKVLIVFQFAISLFFIIGSLAIGRQIHYIRTADLGFNADAICTIDAWRTQPQQMQLLAEKMRSLAGVKDVVLQNSAPMGLTHNGGSLVYRGKGLRNMVLLFQFADAGFIPFYGMRLVAGRNYGQGDSVRELVINETYSKALGFDNPADAVGQLLYLDSTNAYAITGVVADFYQRSFHKTILPEAIGHFPGSELSIAVKLAVHGRQGASAKAIVESIKAVWKKVLPKEDFRFSFLNESISQLHSQDTNTAFLLQSAMVITILISCMGFFGLALFTAGRREKEVGIRKVLGATVANVAVLLSRDFVVLVLIALAIASPLAWYFADTWLEDFVYRVPMNAWVLLEAAGLAVLLLLLTVGFLTLQAALRKPATVLRRE